MNTRVRVFEERATGRCGWKSRMLIVCASAAAAHAMRP